MNDQGYKFNTIAEHFPAKLRALADSIDKTIPELRDLIHKGVYYIDESCEVVENPVNKALYDFGQALKEDLATVQQAVERLSKFGLKGSKGDDEGTPAQYISPREMMDAYIDSIAKDTDIKIGIAGEKLRCGDLVILGSDGRVYKSKEINAG